LKILILKPSSLGDVVQALPVLRLLKQSRPSSEIFWWLDASLVPLLQDDPDLAGVIPFERRRWASPFHWNELLGSILNLRQKNFDWVIDLQGLARSGTFAWLANGKLLVGVDDPREGANGFYDLAVPRPSYETHAVDWYLEVLKRLGVPITDRFDWIPERPAAKRAVQQKWKTDAARWIVICPGARWMNKRWPVEYYAELVALLAAADGDFRFAILGSSGDFELGETIAAAESTRALNLAGKTSLPEMIEWIRLSELVITNDTGPMHVAAALQKPLVALFGPTNPARTGPYRQHDRVLRISLPCAPCLKDSCAYERPMDCLRAIPPSSVHREIRRRWPALFP
jgi:heptosyltransferase-1